jgi:hypothetical protein
MIYVGTAASAVRSGEARRQIGNWPLTTGNSIYEGKSISKEDLRQVQDHSPQRRGAGDLRELETQTAPGVKRALSNEQTLNDLAHCSPLIAGARAAPED